MDVLTTIQPKDDMLNAMTQNMGVVFSGRVAIDTVDKKSETQDKKQVSDKDAQIIADNMNQVASAFNTELSFSVDKDTGKTIIKVMDKGTGETIRQIPPEETLKLIRKMKNVMGMLFDIEM
jgi:flagellar protein FlaG